MKRLRRIAWNLSAAISVFVLLAAISIWVLGRWHTIILDSEYDSHSPAHDYRVQLNGEAGYKGSVSIYFTWAIQRISDVEAEHRRNGNVPHDEFVKGVGLIEQFWDTAPMEHDAFGFGFASHYYKGPDTPYPQSNRPNEIASRYFYFDLKSPLWCIVIITAVLPLLWLGRHQRAALRSRVGFCRACGYDLRATPDRCPECGAVPAEK